MAIYIEDIVLLIDQVFQFGFTPIQFCTHFFSPFDSIELGFRFEGRWQVVNGRRGRSRPSKGKITLRLWQYGAMSRRQIGQAGARWAGSSGRPILPSRYDGGDGGKD